MTARRDTVDLDLSAAMPLDEMLVWNAPASATKPEEAARKDFAEALERHRAALEETLKRLAKKS